jgi:hypothetical protein
VTEDDERAAECVVETIYYFNVRCPVGTPLPDIEYRSSDGEIDILRHVFRWDRAPYDFVFQHGFEARRQENTPDSVFYNLERYVNSGGRPLDIRRDTTHGFVSTTISSSWFPPVNSGTVDRVYRYEIYAPGGILVSETLGDLYRYPAQDEVAFPAGIAPQYIRSAQLFELANDRRYTRRTRVNNVLYINSHFNPQSHPPRELKIQYPVSRYNENGETRKLEIQMVPEQRLQKRSMDTNDDELVDYYTEEVTDVDYYIDSAFRSTRRNEAYIFIKGQYVLINYAPGTTGDRVVNGPHFIGSSFHSLVGTVFAEYGIDAAFGCHDRDDNEAMIFSGNLSARINYAPGTTDDWIIEGPKTIRQKFPFFKGTHFEGGIDAAFESTVTGEAYLFKGSEYALIDYSKPSLIAMRPITEGFQCLRNTIFEREIGAAFASHVDNEAYLFKGNSYVLLHFTPGETKDYIISGPKEIVPANWPSLNGILPQKNIGLDIFYEFPQPEKQHRDHDEL